MDVTLVVMLVVLAVIMLFLITALFGAPYVPSRKKEIMGVFTYLRPLNHKDVLVDFGCGDGVVLRAAVKSGAGRAEGLELNPILASFAKMKSRGNRRIKVRCGDMNMMRLPEDMTVVYVFGLDRVMKMIKPKIEKFAREQGREIDVISHAFEFAGMKAEKKYRGFYLYKIKG
jgi:hypothetical protein